MDDPKTAQPQVPSNSTDAKRINASRPDATTTSAAPAPKAAPPVEADPYAGIHPDRLRQMGIDPDQHRATHGSGESAAPTGGDTRKRSHETTRNQPANGLKKQRVDPTSASGGAQVAPSNSTQSQPRPYAAPYNQQQGAHQRYPNQAYTPQQPYPYPPYQQYQNPYYNQQYAYYYQQQQQYYGGYGYYPQPYPQAPAQVPVPTDMSGAVPGKTACNTLYVSNLADNTQEHQITQLFGMQPGFSSANFQSRPGKPPLAFVQYMDAGMASAALQALNGWGLNGKSIVVTFARSEMKARTTYPTPPQMAPGTGNPAQVPQAAGTTGSWPSAISTLYISNLTVYTSEEQLRKLLAQYQNFTTMHFTQRPGKSPFAFAKFASPEAAGKALTGLGTQSLNGSVLKVTYAKSEMKA